MVVDHVEVAVAREALERVLELPERLPDPLARGAVEDGVELRAGVRVARGEERDVVTGVREPVGEQRDDPLDPAVARRRDGEPHRAEDGDLHAALTLTLPAVDAHVPRASRSARTPSSSSPSTQAGALLGGRPQLARADVGLEAEDQPQEQHRRPGRPRLRPRGGRIGDRERSRAALEAGEDLGQRPVEEARRLEQRQRDPLRVGRPARARQPPGAERRVVGPDGAVVVAERVVGRVDARHRADAPARPEPVARSACRRRTLVRSSRHDPAPEQVAEVRARSSRPAASRRRARARRSRRGRSTQNASSNRVPQLGGLALQPLGERRVRPHRARQLGQPQLRVVDVALHLGRRDRRPRERAVVEALRVAGVLPRLVLEAARRAPLVLDEPVAVAVAVLVDPARAPRAPARAAARRAPRRPSSARPRRAGRGRAASRRRCRSTCRTTSRPPGPGAARGGSCRARRRSRDRPPAPAARRARRARRSRAPARAASSAGS